MEIDNDITSDRQPCAICISKCTSTFTGGVGEIKCSKCGRWVCPLHAKENRCSECQEEEGS